MKLIKKFQDGKKFSNTPTGRAMQRQYDSEHGITMQKVLPEVEVFPNYYNIDDNGYSNSFAIPLEHRPTTFSQGEISQPYVPKKLDEQGWLSRTFGINNFGLGIMELIGNPANVVPTGKTIQGIKALTSVGSKAKNAGQTVLKVKRVYTKPNANIMSVNNTIQTDSPVIIRTFEDVQKLQNEGYTGLIQDTSGRSAYWENGEFVKMVSEEPKVSTNIKNITPENAHTMSADDWDAAYTKAVIEDNIYEAQRLSDLHAQVNGYNITSYRGQFPNNVYLRQRLNPYSTVRTSGNSSGYFSSTSEDVGRTYVYDNNSPLFKLYSRIDNPKIIDANGGNWRTVGTDRAVNQAMREGHDGVIIKNVMDVGPTRANLNGASDIADDIVTSPGGSKLADAVTRDNSGEVIPLSLRHNKNNPDIRYGLLPFILGGGYKYISQDSNSTEYANGGKLIKLVRK